MPLSPRRNRFIILLAAFCMTACTAAPDAPPTPAPDSAIIIAQAEQVNAPALAVSDDLVAVWVGSDDRGVHQDARRLSAETPGEIITLPLPPTHPHDQRLFPGIAHSLHLTWRDSADDGTTVLWTGLLTADLEIARGPVNVSGGSALAYDAISDSSGGLLLVWGGGSAVEPDLYTRRLDSDGRPLQSAVVARSAADPALLRTASGETWLFYISGGQLIRRRLEPPAEGEPQPLTGAVSLAPGDFLVNVGAAAAATTAYFYWNVSRSSGTHETWITSGSLDAQVWHQPEKLQFEGESFSWFAPLRDQRETLLAAAQSSGGIGIVRLRGGKLAAYEIVVPDTRLVGLPSLIADAQGGVYLAWAQPNQAVADLKLLELRN